MVRLNDRRARTTQLLRPEPPAAKDVAKVALPREDRLPTTPRADAVTAIWPRDEAVLGLLGSVAQAVFGFRRSP